MDEEMKKALEQFIAETKTQLGTAATGVEVKALEEKMAALAAQLQTVETHIASKLHTGGDPEEGKSFGRRFVESDGFKSLAKGAQSTGKVDVGSFKAVTSGTVVEAHRIPGIVSGAEQRLTIRDILPSIPTGSNMVEFVKESAFTNSAAPVTEAAAKPESDLTYALVQSPVQVIAHFIKVSLQALNDIPQIEAEIDRRMLYGLRLKEEAQILSGTGTAPNLSGLVTQATALTGAAVGDTLLDLIIRGIEQCETAGYPAEFVVLNPTDWFKIQRLKDTQGRYLFSDPHQATDSPIWGNRPIISASLSAGNFLVGSSMAAAIYDRQNATVEIATQDADNFQKNMATIRVEERLALAVYRPSALIYGSLTAPTA
jgi:HK97 family phage major capsid protein